MQSGNSIPWSSSFWIVLYDSYMYPVVPNHLKMILILRKTQHVFVWCFLRWFSMSHVLFSLNEGHGPWIEPPIPWPALWSADWPTNFEGSPVGRFSSYVSAMIHPEKNIKWSDHSQSTYYCTAKVQSQYYVQQLGVLMPSTYKSFFVAGNHLISLYIVHANRA